MLNISGIYQRFSDIVLVKFSKAVKKKTYFNGWNPTHKNGKCWHGLPLHYSHIIPNCLPRSCRGSLTVLAQFSTTSVVPRWGPDTHVLNSFCFTPRFHGLQAISNQFQTFSNSSPSFTIFYHLSSYLSHFSRYLWFPVPFWTSRTRPPTAPFMWQAWQRQGPPRSGFLYLFMGYGHLSHNRDPNTMAI